MQLEPSKATSVSVIVPAHNAAGTIGACLRSVLASDHDGEREVIVVDDGSTDGTPTIAEQLGCRVIRQSTNGGPALARNAGAEAARGEVLIFVDADTEMRRDSIREALRALEEPGVGAVTGMYEPEPLNGGFFPAYYAYFKYHAFTAHPVDRIHAFGAQCAAIRRDLFDRAGGFRAFPWGVDIENDEFGHRVCRHSAIALSTRFRVGHNFADFRKLLSALGRDDLLKKNRGRSSMRCSNIGTILSIMASNGPKNWGKSLLG